jgi:type IV pilus assembly protein PilA
MRNFPESGLRVFPHQIYKLPFLVEKHPLPDLEARHLQPTHHHTMNNQTQNKPRKKLLAKVRAGFSLVELLVVIAVIGIIAAIAIPNIAGITGNATVAKNQRNAQNLASTFAAARAAGAEDNITTATQAADAVIAGSFTFPSGSSYSGATFKVANMSDDDRDKAVEYLVINSPGTASQLEYNAGATITP